MDPHIISHAILSTISSYFPGGSAKFIEEGGAVAPLPQIGACLIYHPNPPTEFRQKLDKTKIDLGFGLPGIIFSFVDTINFDGISMDVVYGQIKVAAEEIRQRFNIDMVLVTPNPTITFVNIPELKFSNDSELQEVLSILSENIDGLIRMVIIGDNGFYPVDLEEPSKNEVTIFPEKAPEAVIPQAEYSNNIPSVDEIKKGIGGDDVINLRIELALCDEVQDFIDKM